MPVTASDDGDGGPQRYGTVEGVFVPTLLTILGVILFLRTGWVIGNAGLVGALGIIVLTFAIVGCTALSLSSISTNVTPPAGGAYALVARSFGVEAGGAVGIPLYLSQTFVIVLYTFGFRDGWLAVFPDHPPLVVDLSMCVVLVGVTLVSTRAAFRLQFVILGVVTAALISIGVAVLNAPPPGPITLFGDFPGAPERGFPGTDLWTVFAVFFPAATGIMAGLNLSGELRAPRRSIMRGTLAAVGCSFLIYVAVAVGLAFLAPSEELVANYFVLIDRAAWPPVVLAGLLAATFSSALASLVGAPRILQALAGHDVLPGSAWLKRRDARGEPRNALLVTVAILITAVVGIRELNAIASLITMIFLLTYGAINLSVLVESIVGLTSYRPTFRVPWVVPLVGAVGCLGAMAIIDVVFTVLAIALGAGVLGWLGKRRIDRPVSDIRSGALLALARWSTRKAAEISSSAERGWTPQLLLPVTNADDLTRTSAWIGHLVSDAGTARLAVLHPEGGADDALDQQVEEAVDRLRTEKIDASAVAVEGSDDTSGALTALRWEANGDKAWAPTMLMTDFPADASQDAATRTLLREAYERGVGVVLLPPCAPPEQPDDAALKVGLWIRGPASDWKVGRNLPRSNLALLIAYQLARNPDFDLCVITAVQEAQDAGPARAYLEEVVELARLPESTIVRVNRRSFPSALEEVTDTALNVLSLPPHVDFVQLRRSRDISAAPCLFIRDSGVENAFA
jgi:amino acid transporter